jgi:hypothetical protein
MPVAPKKTVYPTIDLAPPPPPAFFQSFRTTQRFRTVPKLNGADFQRWRDIFVKYNQNIIRRLKYNELVQVGHGGQSARRSRRVQ